jgi:hypothetical protein
MCQPWKFLRRLVMTVGLSCVLFSASGCGGTLIGGFAQQFVDFAVFWQTTPPVPVLDPVEGEHAPLFCLDPPQPDEVMRTLPDKVGGGIFFLAEKQHNNVHIVTELLVDRIDECRFFPLVGPARLHHCHYKCTVYYEQVIRSDWPIPYSHKKQKQEIVYIDHDHLIRCAGPPTPQ